MSSSTVWKVWRGFSYHGNCESECTAFDAVEPGQFPERVARSVIKTTVSLPSCQQAQSTRWQCRRSRPTSQVSPSPEIQLGTRGDSTEAVYTSRHGEQIQLREQRQQQQQCSIAYELTGGVCEVARHPPHWSRSRRCTRRHIKLTVKRPPPYTFDSNHLHDHANRASKSWRSDVSIILPGWVRHTGGSQSIPTVHPCGLRPGGCG